MSSKGHPWEQPGVVRLAWASESRSVGSLWPPQGSSGPAFSPSAASAWTLGPHFPESRATQGLYLLRDLLMTVAQASPATPGLSPDSSARSQAVLPLSSPARFFTSCRAQPYLILPTNVSLAVVLLLNTAVPDPYCWAVSSEGEFSALW